MIHKTKIIIGILVILSIIISLVGKVFGILYWQQLGWDLSGFNMFLPIVIFLGSAIYIILAYLTEAHIIFKILGFLGLIYGAVQSFLILISHLGGLF